MGVEERLPPCQCRHFVLHYVLYYQHDEETLQKRSQFQPGPPVYHLLLRLWITEVWAGPSGPSTLSWSFPLCLCSWMVVIVWLEWLFHLLLTKKIYCINCLITRFDNSWLITQFGRLGRAMHGKVPYFICFSYFWKPISVYPSSWFYIRPKTDRLK